MEPQSPGPLLSNVCLYTSLSSASEALGSRVPFWPGCQVLVFCATLLMIIKLSLNVYGKMFIGAFSISPIKHFIVNWASDERS